MDKLGTGEKIRKCMGDVFEIDVSLIGNESSRETLAAWDSLRHVNLVLALQDEFNLEFAPDDIPRMFSYRDIFNIISDRTKQ